MSDVNIPGIPQSEMIWVQRLAGNKQYFITSKESRDCYYLYRVDSGKAIKLGKARSPLELEEQFIE